VHRSALCGTRQQALRCMRVCCTCVRGGGGGGMLRRPDRYFGNMVVEQLNAIAGTIMAANKIPVIDLYSQVTAFCGQVYKVRAPPPLVSALGCAGLWHVVAPPSRFVCAR
jgi:hypothetical protein